MPLSRRSTKPCDYCGTEEHKYEHVLDCQNHVVCSRCMIFRVILSTTRGIVESTCKFCVSRVCSCCGQVIPGENKRP
jgi:hypothetical protein